MPKARPIELGDPVYVEWVDASRSAFGWTPEEKLEKHTEGSTPVRSLGFVVRLDEEQISVAHNASEGQVLFVTNIPRGMVTALRRVR